MKRVKGCGKSALVFLLPFFLMQCTTSDDQREFEQEAFSMPSGITETDESGAVTGHEDPDDWRTGPFYQGIIEVEPAFPNPVQTTNKVDIYVTITVSQPNIRGIYVYALFDDGPTLIDDLDLAHSEPFGFVPFRIPATELMRFDTRQNIPLDRRIIILDERQNVISYGDIRVE